MEATPVKSPHGNREREVGLWLATICAKRSISLENQDREFGVGGEFRDPDGLPPQDPLPIPRRVRPATEPNHLWRRPDGWSRAHRSPSRRLR